MSHVTCLVEGQQDKQPKEAPKKGSPIRTMKSDIAEFLKETKPSLISIITKEAERHEKQPAVTQELKFLRPGLLTGVLIIFVAVSAYFFYSYFSKTGAPSAVKIIPPPALFATEKSRTINLKAGDKTAIRRGLNDSADEKERNGTMKRTLFKIIEKNGEEHFMTIEEFFSGLDILPPPEFLSLLDKNLMAAVYYQNEGPRLVVGARTTKPERVEETMLKWEVSIQRDILPFFLKERVETKLIPFEDRSFRNIDWRYLKLDNIRDLGVGYAIFQAKNYLIISTSKEAMETVISRLFATD